MESAEQPTENRDEGQFASSCPLCPQKQTSPSDVVMSALCQKWTHAPQQISSLLDRLVSRFVAARFLNAEDHAVARIGRALRHDRGDAGPAKRGN